MIDFGCVHRPHGQRDFYHTSMFQGNSDGEGKRDEGKEGVRTIRERQIPRKVRGREWGRKRKEKEEGKKEEQGKRRRKIGRGRRGSSWRQKEEEKKEEKGKEEVCSIIYLMS